MRLPQSRFGFASRKSRGRLNINKFFLVLLAVCVLGAGVFWLMTREPAAAVDAKAAERGDLLALWEAKNYQEIIRVTEEGLRNNPMDAESLVFNGFAHFYTGANQTVTEEKLAHIDAAIMSLRRVRLYEEPPLPGEVDYVLGKAYYQKGEFYSDLSVQYMTSAIERDFVGQDSYEYLGLAYNSIGEFDKSIAYLLKAGEQNPSDMLYLVLAQTYYQTGEKAAAEEYLDRAVNKSSDPALIQKARMLLGDMYLQAEEFLKAEAQYLKIVDLNPQNADAHFYLGEIYNNLGDPIKARASWRRAVWIDPNHFGAKTRLYG